METRIKEQHDDCNGNGDSRNILNRNVVKSNGHSQSNGSGDGHSNSRATVNGYDYDSHPFVYRLYPTRTERLTWYLMAFTVAPIRLAFVVLFLVLAWIPAAIAVVGLPLQPDNPFSPWRLALKDVTVFFVRCAWFSVGVVSQTVKGKQASSKEAPVIVMGPHSSFVDTLGGALCGFPGVVSVIENGRLPLIGTLFRVNQSIFVNRGDPDSRSKTAQRIRKRAEANGAWPQLVIFPEGVCSSCTALLPYKLGAFLPGVSIQPVTLKYNRMDLQTWVNTGPGLVALFTLLLCTPKTSFEVEFHPVYHPSEEEKKDPELYAKNVRDLMSRYLGLPKTEIGYSDLINLVKRSRPNRGVLHMWKNIITKGCIEMPSREHFS